MSIWGPAAQSAFSPDLPGTVATPGRSGSWRPPYDLTPLLYMKSMKILAILAPLVLAELLEDSCGKAGGSSKTAALLQLPNVNQSQKLRLGLVGVFCWSLGRVQMFQIKHKECLHFVRLHWWTWIDVFFLNVFFGKGVVSLEQISCSIIFKDDSPTFLGFQDGFLVSHGNHLAKSLARPWLGRSTHWMMGFPWPESYPLGPHLELCSIYLPAR